MSPLVKKLSWALACSLALNLFLLGFGMARLLGHERHHHGARVRLDEGELDRRLPRRWFGDHVKHLREQHREVARARKQVADALSAEPFDAEKLKQALATLRATMAAGQERLHEALVESATRASTDERMRLAHSRFLREMAPPPPPPEHH